MAPHGSALKFLQQTVQNLPDENQLGFVLKQISAEINAAVLVFDARGELIDSIGGAPSELIWESVEADPSKLIRTIGRWTIRFRRFGPNRKAFALVFATRIAGEIAAPPEILDAAEIAVNAVLAVIRETDVRWVQENAQLLEILEQGIPQAREHRFWPRLVEFGFTAYVAFIVIVDESMGDHTPTREFLRDIHERAYLEGVPLLAATRLTMAASDATVHMLVPDRPEIRDWILRESQGCAVGISRPYHALTDLPIGLREAEYAQQIATSRAKARIALEEEAESITEVIDYQKLRLGAWIAVHSPPREFHTRKRDILVPFDDHSEILDTVIIFLASDLNVNDTARKLFLHPNTIRYRIGRAENLLGASLSSPLILTDLTLALYSQILARRQTV